MDYIKEKQKYWARLKKLDLIGSQIERGDKIYCRDLHDNLFLPLSNESKAELEAGDGNELGGGETPGKMQALHSSSALGVNVFEYWRYNKNFSPIAKALKIPSRNIGKISYEKKFKALKGQGTDPNIDVVFEYANGTACAIECKFTEAYSNRKVPLRILTSRYSPHPCICRCQSSTLLNSNSIKPTPI